MIFPIPSMEYVITGVGLPVAVALIAIEASHPPSLALTTISDGQAISGTEQAVYMRVISVPDAGTGPTGEACEVESKTNNPFIVETVDGYV